MRGGDDGPKPCFPLRDRGVAHCRSINSCLKQFLRKIERLGGIADVNGTDRRSADLNRKPRFLSSRLKNFVLAQSFLTKRSPSGESSRVKAAWHAAAVAGGCEV